MTTLAIRCPDCQGAGFLQRPDWSREEVCDNCGGRGKIPRRVVVRVSRHCATGSHWDAAQAVYGEEISLRTKDVPYGDDPVAAVTALIESVETEGRDVVAVEAAGPEPVLVALVQGLSVPVLRPVFRRDGSRVVVVGKDAGGRDIFDVERYERLDVEMRPTIVGKPLEAA